MIKHLACLGFAFGCLAATPALAEERACVGRVTGGNYDNIRVPDGRNCTLVDVRLNGSITVGTNASLTATRARVNGNIQAEGARLVDLKAGTTAGGSVQLKQGVAIRLTGIATKGDIQLDQNAGRITAQDNRTDGNFQVVGNLGGVTLNRNTIRGSLQCKENDPAPTGANNNAGDKEDQCAAL